MLTDKLHTGTEIENHDVTIVRTRELEFSVYCEDCHKDVSRFTSEQLSEWRRSIETGEPGPIETGQGALCSNG